MPSNFFRTTLLLYSLSKYNLWENLTEHFIIIFVRRVYMRFESVRGLFIIRITCLKYV